MMNSSTMDRDGTDLLRKAAMATPALAGLALVALAIVPLWVGLVVIAANVPVFMAQGRWVRQRAEAQPNTAEADTPGAGIDPVAPAIIDSLPDALLAVDRDGLVVESNQSARDLLGTGLRDRHIGLSLRQPDALAAIDKGLASDTLVELEITLLAPGERFFAMLVLPINSLTDRETHPTLGADIEGGAIVVLHDVTAQKKAEQLRADFVSNASHELRTPLASLVGFIETLQTSANDDAEARGKFLDIMARESGRMSRLVDDLLSLSRIEMDEHVRPRGVVDLRQVIVSVVEALEFRAADRHISLEMDLPDGMAPVQGDHDQLIQVIQNLTDNAIKYGDQDSVVMIRAYDVPRVPETGGPGLAVEIINKGEVIPPEHLPRLTDRFYRVDPARSRVLGSTGLGLAIVKHIVSRHRGELSFESNAVRGTVATVAIPAKTDK